MRPSTLLSMVLLSTSLPAIASAQEYKLVLTPEPGQAPPARVCLVSRNREMTKARARGEVAPLSKRVKCVDGRCEAERDTRPARCQTCPDVPHPGCSARLDLGERPLDDYSVVCADDDTSPAEGGTVYISVESVEAENPPEFYDAEVSGGRVRWSPLNRISRPSYRVLGGDFDPSRLSYPRVPSDRPWAEVPVTRRCRCLDARILGGVSRPASVLMDGAPVCRGEVSTGRLLPVEVPATTRDRVSVLRTESAEAKLATRWSTRWPEVPIDLAPTEFEFSWVMPCMWPRETVCPTASIRGARCDAPEPRDGICPYRCSVVADEVITLPIEVGLHLDNPSLDFSTILGGIGEVESGRIPPDQRVVWTDVTDWDYMVPGDRIRAIEVLAVDGSRVTIELSAQESDRLMVPLPRAQCGTSLRTRLIGERDYSAGYGHIRQGANFRLPPPEDLVIGYDLFVGVGAGAAAMSAVGDSTETTISLAMSSDLAVRLRAAASRWSAEARLVGAYINGWPYSPITSNGSFVTHTHRYMSMMGEVGIGFTDMVLTRAMTAHLNIGGGAVFDPFEVVDARVEQGRGVGSIALGLTVPVTTDYTAPLFGRFDLRYIYGARKLHYQALEQFDGSGSGSGSPEILRIFEPVHAIMLVAALNLRL